MSNKVRHSRYHNIELHCLTLHKDKNNLGHYFDNYNNSIENRTDLNYGKFDS